jgi:hypothetical protein
MEPKHLARRNKEESAILRQLEIQKTNWLYEPADYIASWLRAPQPPEVKLLTSQVLYIKTTKV